MNTSKIKGRSIRTKIITALVGLSLISLVAVSFIVGLQIHKELKDQATLNLVSNVNRKSNEYNLIFERLAQEAESVAVFASDLLQRHETFNKIDHQVLLPWVNQGDGTGFNKGYGSPKLEDKYEYVIPRLQRIGKMMSSIASKNKLIAEAYFSTADGVFVGYDNQQIINYAKREGYIPTKRDWYKQARIDGETIWSEPYIGASQGRLMVTVATPVYTPRKELLGVVGFDVLLKNIKEDVLSIDTGFDGYPLLISNDGTALATPEAAKGTKKWNVKYQNANLLQTNNKDWNDVVKKMVAGIKGIGEFEDNGINYLAYAPVNALNASLGLVVSEEKVVAPAFNILKWIAAIATIISIFSIFVGTSLGNSISRPIIELTESINKASTGKSGLEPLKITSKDELGLLTEAFNRLTKSLKIALNLNSPK